MIKIFNLPRGSGKTTRMLYASEFNNAPIICSTESRKRHIIKAAKELNLEIPDPLTVHEIKFNAIGRIDKYLVDNALEVLYMFLTDRMPANSALI